ncbi:putative Major facilitator superfamily domain-containing protein [Seiridium cardinale]|uniref:Major facilitator superfamily domain-containing protein n=1 Tax=Seiridium cardinale TaxID=138064 RepID=A0ABR2XND0_9PEZI
MSAVDEPTEASPLLIKPDASTPPSEEQPPSQDLGWTKDATRTAVLTTAFLTLFAFADILKYVSTIRLVELGVCREHYLETDPGLVGGNGMIPEHLCKSPAIQQSLAHLRGYLSALEAIVGLLLTVPYGLVVARLGERLLAGINVVGYLMSCAWLIAVCFYWSVFPTWTTVLSPLFRVVGGGSPFLSSLVYSIAAKHIPVSKRSLCFFIFLAAQTITSTIAALITAALLDRGLLLTPLMLNFPIGVLCLLTLVVLHIDNSSESVPGRDNEPDADKSNTFSSIRHSIRILSEALRDRNVLILLATVPVAKAVNPIGEVTWQYVPKKYGISLAAASRVLSIPSIECLVLLIVILPYINNIAQERYHFTAIKVDLYFVQYGFLIQGLGCLIMAFSQTLTVFILGILVFALGCSTKPALQSVLAGLVNREHIAVLFTVVAVADGIGSAAGAVILNWAFAIALGWDTSLYLGLPFIIGAASFVLAFIASVYVGYSAFRSRRGT